jgi:hypothetical protein
MGARMIAAALWIIGALAALALGTFALSCVVALVVAIAGGLWQALAGAAALAGLIVAGLWRAARGVAALWRDSDAGRPGGE